jgi:hypothetical protein
MKAKLFQERFLPLDVDCDVIIQKIPVRIFTASRTLNLIRIETVEDGIQFHDFVAVVMGFMATKSRKFPFI